MGGRGGSKRKRPNDVVGEKIDMFVAPKRFRKNIKFSLPALDFISKTDTRP